MSVVGAYNGVNVGVSNGLLPGTTMGVGSGVATDDFKTNIVTSGLVFNLDASIYDSYPRSGTAWRDIAVNRSSGTLANSPTFNTGKVPSLAFNNTNQYCNFGNVAALGFNRTDSFSVCGWFRTTFVGGRNVFSKQLNSSTFAGWGLSTNASGFYEVFLYSSAGIVVDFPTGYLDNQWHHIAFTYDGTSLAAGVTLYHNGEPEVGVVVQDALTASITSASSNVQVNGRGLGNNLWNGSVATVQMYNRRLSRRRNKTKLSSTKN